MYVYNHFRVYTQCLVPNVVENVHNYEYIYNPIHKYTYMYVYSRLLYIYTYKHTVQSCFHIVQW